MITAFKQVILALVVLVALSASSWASETNARALELAGQKNFSQALTLLANEDAQTKAGYDHRFLKARILSWSGQYNEANAELMALSRDYPNNADIQVARGNLAYYQGKLPEAEMHYTEVLKRYPQYQDARTGLENVRKAKAAKRSNGRRTWRLDGSVGFSDFSRVKQSDWDEQFLRAEYAPENLAYHGSVQRYKRFGKTDLEIKGGISDAVRGGWDWGVEVGATPNATFRPDFSAGGRVGRAIETDNGTVLYPNVTYRYDDYASGDIHNIQPGVMAYLDNGVVLTGRLIGTVSRNEKDQLGWLVQGRVPASDKLSVNLGYAKAPEAINGVAVTTESLFGGVSYAVRDNLDLHVNLARDDRENSYIRNSVNVGFTYKR